MAKNNYFQFKQFRVEQNYAPMRVGTDGCLLGAWSNVDNVKTALDVGTGTGVIALMLAQRSKAKIDAIDIENNAIIDAQQNFSNSPWSERLAVFHSSLQDYATNCDKKYDCIVSNPPFFVDSEKSKSEGKRTARHTDSLSFSDLLSGVRSLLGEQGKFSVVLPVDVENEFIKEAENLGLYLTKITRVVPKPSKPIKRILMEFQLEKKMVIENELLFETEVRHTYAPETIDLLKDFYLKL